MKSVKCKFRVCAVSPVSSASSAGGSGRRDDETLAIETAWADQNDLSPGAANPHHMPPVLGGANGRRTQPKILITGESSSDQVEEWLKSKFRPQLVIKTKFFSEFPPIFSIFTYFLFSHRFIDF